MKAKITRFAFTLTIVLFGILLFSSAALAQGTNCPHEPSQGTLIADGQIYVGANCTLQSPGDVDGFLFSASSGQTYHLALGINGAAPVNICMTLYDPNEMNVFGTACTNTDGGFGPYSVVKDLRLTTTGTYTIFITENSTGTISYAVALERLYPFAPNAQQINLSTQIPGDINPITDTNEFTFVSATTGTEEVSATLPRDATQNICLRVYQPNGTPVQNDVCTNIDGGFGTYTVQLDFTPTQDGMSMAFLYVNGNDATATYTLEVTCLFGGCGTTTIPDVSGYAIFQGAPLVNAGVSLTQPGSPSPQLTRTDNNGYYQFPHIISGQTYNVLIHGQGTLDTPESGDAKPANRVDGNPRH